MFIAEEFCRMRLDYEKILHRSRSKIERAEKIQSIATWTAIAMPFAIIIGGKIFGLQPLCFDAFDRFKEAITSDLFTLSYVAMFEICTALITILSGGSKLYYFQSLI